MVSIDISLLGQRICVARKRMGMELSNLASKVGITQESLRHIEHGIRKPSLNTVYSLAEELDVSLDYLLGRSQQFCEMWPKSIVEEEGLTEAQKQVLAEILEQLIPIVKKSCVRVECD